MRKNSFIFAGALLLLAFSSCDDGLIYEKLPEIHHNGLNVKLEGKLDGIDKWEAPYTVVLAGFGKDKYAVVQKQVTVSAGGTVNTTLTDISNEVTSIELCVTNRLRERVVSFKTIETADVEDVRDTIRINAGTMDIGMYTTIQEQIFNTTCANCHGGREHLAAGLNLTAEESHNALVGQPSTCVENGTRVIPGDARNSVLHKVVNTGNAANLGFDHANMITSSVRLKLIDDWINGGAKN